MFKKIEKNHLEELVGEAIAKSSWAGLTRMWIFSSLRVELNLAESVGWLLEGSKKLVN